MPVPVGKVEYLYIRPVSFREFLRHADEKIFWFSWQTGQQKLLK
jgi:hypothetical protein